MTREKIKNVALKLYGRYGYEGTSMNEIAKEVGIKKPSLYAHFVNKEEILKETFNEIIAEYRSHLEKITVPEPNLGTYQKLLKIFLEFIMFFEKQPEKKYFWSRIFMFPPESIKEMVNNSIMDAEYAFIKSLYGILINGIRNGEIKNGNVEDMVMLYYYMLTGFLTCSGLGSEEDLHKRIEGCWRVYWDGVKI